MWQYRDLVDWLILPFNQSEGKKQAWHRCHPEHVSFYPVDIQEANDTPLGQVIMALHDFWIQFRPDRVRMSVGALRWAIGYRSRIFLRNLTYSYLLVLYFLVDYKIHLPQLSVTGVFMVFRPKATVPNLSLFPHRFLTALMPRLVKPLLALRTR